MVKIVAKMHDPNTHYNSFQVDDAQFTQSFHNIASVFQGTSFNTSEKAALPDAVMRNKHDKSEMYSELIWNSYKRNEVHVKWKLRNPK